MAHPMKSKLKRAQRRRHGPDPAPGWAATLRHIAELDWISWIRDKAQIQTGLDTTRARVSDALQDLVAQNLRLADQMSDMADRLGRAIDQRNRERGRVNELEARVTDLDQIIDGLEQLLSEERAAHADARLGNSPLVDDDPFLDQRPLVDPRPWHDGTAIDSETARYWHGELPPIVDHVARTGSAGSAGDAAQAMDRAYQIIENPA